MSSAVVWLGNLPEQADSVLEFFDRKKDWVLETDALTSGWLMAAMPQLLISHQPILSYGQLKESYETFTKKKFETFTASPVWSTLCENGLLIL